MITVWDPVATQVDLIMAGYKVPSSRRWIPAATVFTYFTLVPLARLGSELN